MLPHTTFSLQELIIHIKSKFTTETTGYVLDEEEPTAFEKSYVSFPDYMSTRPQLINTIAVPSFCNEPHFKPIWVL